MRVSYRARYCVSDAAVISQSASLASPACRHTWAGFRQPARPQRGCVQWGGWESSLGTLESSTRAWALGNRRRKPVLALFLGAHLPQPRSRYPADRWSSLLSSGTQRRASCFSGVRAARARGWLRATRKSASLQGCAFHASAKIRVFVSHHITGDFVSGCHGRPISLCMRIARMHSERIKPAFLDAAGCKHRLEGVASLSATEWRRTSRHVDLFKPFDSPPR